MKYIHINKKHISIMDLLFENLNKRIKKNKNIINIKK